MATNRSSSTSADAIFTDPAAIAAAPCSPIASRAGWISSARFEGGGYDDAAPGIARLRPWPCRARAPARAADNVDALARDVSRAESLRAVLTLQRNYAQYAQYGLWSEVSRLFARDGRFVFDGQIMPGEKASGQAEIASLLKAHYGGGHEGQRAGDLSTMMIEDPVINLAPDGESAKGRWHIPHLHGPWRYGDHRGRHLRE